MSHLDELDDYEAQLELRLKREYSAVFSLFRYWCADAGRDVFCNTLDINDARRSRRTCSSTRKMEDVWCGTRTA